MEDRFLSALRPLYERFGLSGQQSYIVDQIMTLLIITAVILIIWKASSIIFEKVLPRRFVKKGNIWNIWIDALSQTGFLRYAAGFVPAFIAYFIIPLVGNERFRDIAGRIVMAFIAGIAENLATVFLDVIQLIYQNSTGERAKKMPIKGYFQFIKIFLYIIGGILIITSMMKISPLGILSGVGALSAVLMLIFKDLILGFVAGTQLASNDMVRIGDEIEMPKFNTDGKVIDITLQSVVVRNWDMTISTIPIYSLLSDSFRNWRGVEDGPGWRIKRALYIDMDSVYFLPQEKIANLSQIPLLSEQIRLKLDEINAHNKEKSIPPGSFTLERRLTNLGVFRLYIELYIKSLSILAPNMPFVVRHNEPSEKGLPLELYLYCSDKSWVDHERVQADIFDHLFAIISEFGLRVYQSPSGADMRLLGDKISGADRPTLPPSTKV
jgi:miniconductance mechanosensitive channel